MDHVKNRDFYHIRLYGPVETSTGVEISTKMFLPKNPDQNSDQDFILSLGSEMHLKAILRPKSFSYQIGKKHSFENYCCNLSEKRVYLGRFQESLSDLTISILNGIMQ